MVCVKKIIHIDRDCFYAAIEMRDNPAPANEPIAIGGSSNRRSVICTSNYIARKYGVRSAMPTNRKYLLNPFQGKNASEFSGALPLKLADA